jgi:DNA-directed RNA polymerase subunit RPC12/RpoP
LKKTPKHKTAWEDQQTAMIESCGGSPLSPGNAPILQANKPIRCPKCGDYIVLRWKVFIKEVSEEEFLRLNGYEINEAI